MVDTTHCTICGREFYQIAIDESIYSVWEEKSDESYDEECGSEEVMVLCANCFRAGVAAMQEKVKEAQ